MKTIHIFCTGYSEGEVKIDSVMQGATMMRVFAIFPPVIPKSEEAMMQLIPMELSAPSSVQERMMGNVISSTADLSLSSITNSSGSPRKKRKVSFAPGPPTSFGHQSLDPPLREEVSRPSLESVPRRSTRSSSQSRNPTRALRSTTSAAAAETSPVHAHPAAERGDEEKPNLSSESAEKLSDEESVGSIASSVGENSSESMATKRWRRSQLMNSPLLVATGTVEEAGATEKDMEAVMVMVPKQGIARGEWGVL